MFPAIYFADKPKHTHQEPAQEAVRYADALIDELRYADVLIDELKKGGEK